MLSSLLVALPIENVRERDLAFETAEAEFVGGIEIELLLLEGKLVTQLTERLIKERGDITKDSLIEVCIWE